MEANWAGNISLDLTIAIADGTLLSVTGEGDLAEVKGDSSLVNGTRLFEVSPGGGLALTRLQLSGSSSTDGGAIYSSSGNLTLVNCTCEGNDATDGSGSAVWASGGDVTIVGGKFSFNNANIFGGAVHVTDGVLETQGGVKFEGNEASVGSALFCGLTSERSASSLDIFSLT